MVVINVIVYVNFMSKWSLFMKLQRPIVIPINNKKLLLITVTWAVEITIIKKTFDKITKIWYNAFR